VESVENSKTQSEFSTLSTGLGNPAKGGPDFHISTAPTTGFFILKIGRKKCSRNRIPVDRSRSLQAR